MGGYTALTDVPERIPDGEYRLFVENVFADAGPDQFTRTAAVEFHPP